MVVIKNEAGVPKQLWFMSNWIIFHFANGDALTAVVWIYYSVFFDLLKNFVRFSGIAHEILQRFKDQTQFYDL